MTKVEKKIYNQAYYKKNLVEIRQSQLLYRRSHKAQLSEMHAIHYRTNKSRIKKERAQYQKDNPDKCRAFRHRHRTRKTNAGGSFTAEEWANLKRKYGHKCLGCSRRKPLEADHVIPVVHGGTSFISNIQPLCRSCNAKKNDKHIDYR